MAEKIVTTQVNREDFIASCSFSGFSTIELLETLTNLDDPISEFGEVIRKRVREFDKLFRDVMLDTSIKNNFIKSEDIQKLKFAYYHHRSKNNFILINEPLINLKREKKKYSKFFKEIESILNISGNSTEVKEAMELLQDEIESRLTTRGEHIKNANVELNDIFSELKYTLYQQNQIIEMFNNTLN